MNWKKKLTSRKLWAAIVSFAALLVVALGGTQAQATQITALIMAGATVVAYIVGEGLVDAASAGAATTTQYNAPIIGTVDPTPAEVAQTGADQAAEVKQDTALSSAEAARAAFPGIDNVTMEQIDTAIEAANIAIPKADGTEADKLNLALEGLKTLRTAKTAESEAVASGTTGAV